LAAAEVRAGFPVRPRETGLEQRGLEILAFARFQPADVRAEDAVERGYAARDVVHRDADLGRPPAGVAGHHHDAGHALGDDVEAAFPAVRTGLSEAGHRGVDDAGIGLAYRRVIYAELAGHAGAEILGDDVGLRGQLEENLLAARILHVEREAFLVAV